MSALPDGQPTRAAEDLTDLAITLVQQATLFSRVVFAHLDGELTRTEASVLNRLDGGAQRVTDLAELDGLAQPTMTLIVKQLEDRELVQRDRSTADRRVVLVSLTARGVEALASIRRRYREVLAGRIQELDSGDCASLLPALRVVNELVAHLQETGFR